MTTATETKKDKDIESLNGHKRHGRGICPRCGKRSTKGFVKLDVVKYGEERSAKGAKHIKSMGRSMCGTCIVKVYRELTEKFEEMLEG